MPIHFLSLSVCVSVLLFIHPSNAVHPPFLSVHLSVHLFVHLSVCPSISACSSIIFCLSVCLSVCLYFEGSNIQKILKTLDVLDNHSFYNCRTHNPLTILYCRIAALQRTTEVSIWSAVKPIFTSWACAKCVWLVLRLLYVFRVCLSV